MAGFTHILFETSPWCLDFTICTTTHQLVLFPQASRAGFIAQSALECFKTRPILPYIYNHLDARCNYCTRHFSGKMFLLHPGPGAVLRLGPIFPV